MNQRPQEEEHSPDHPSLLFLTTENELKKPQNEKPNTVAYDYLDPPDPLNLTGQLMIQNNPESYYTRSSNCKSILSELESFKFHKTGFEATQNTIGSEVEGDEKELEQIEEYDNSSEDDEEDFICPEVKILDEYIQDG